MSDEHQCTRQEEFDRIRADTGDLKTELKVNTEMTARLEMAMTKMAESVQKLSECTIEMKATQVTSAVFNAKFDSLETRFREEKDLCVRESQERDQVLHDRIDKVKAVVDRHDVYFYIMGAVIMLLAANTLDIIDFIRSLA